MKILKCLILQALLTGLALTVAAVHAQDDQSGFISLDCGSPEGSEYTDETTGITYISDSNFTQGGLSMMISPSYKTNSVLQQFSNLRAFPNGTRNCYTLRPPRGKGNKYLIRASFFYGNYDALNHLPSFDLHLGVDYWWTATFEDAATPATAEIIHIPLTDYINVCLVKTGVSTPFISTLELRHLNNTDPAIYQTKTGSLQLFLRLNIGLQNNSQSVRYKDDIYDWIWLPYGLPNVNSISTVSNNFYYNHYQVPSAVMRSANTPLNANEPLEFYWETKNSSDQFYLYLHFAELEQLQANQSR